MKSLRLLLLLMLSFTGIIKADELVIQDFQLLPEQQTSVAVELNNTDRQYIMLDFFIQLPSGVTIARDEDDELMYELNSTRARRSHSLEIREQSNGSYRVLLYSTSNEAFKGTSGTVFTMTLEADASATSGDYTGALTNQLAMDINKNKLNFPDKSFNVLIKSVQQPQSLSLENLPVITYGDAAYTLQDKTDQNQTLTWSSNNSSVATISGNTLTVKGAGTATITASQVGSESYTPFSKTFTLTVNKAALTVTADDCSRMEGAANPAFTISYSGFKYNDNASSLSTQPTAATEATTSSPAGTYPITVSGGESDNYEFNFVNGTLTVTAKNNQTISLSSIPVMTYGDGSYNLPSATDQGLAITWSSSNTSVATVSGNTLTVKGAGETSVTAANDGDTTHNPFSKSYTLTVNKAALTVTADDCSRMEGAANPAFTISYSGFKYNDNASSLTTQPTAASEATTSSPAGTYPITVSGGSSDNYEFNYVNGTLTVTAKNNQTISLSSIPVMTYGDDAYNLPSATDQGLALTWTCSNTSVATVSGNTLMVKGAGTATITASQVGSESYNPFTEEFTLTVNKATLTVTADDQTKTAGDENPEFTVSYSGFVNDDNLSSLTTQPMAASEATASSPAGVYPITVSGGQSDNYEFNYVNGTLTVEMIASDDLTSGKYYLKNVATGKFWGAGNSWGTQASLVDEYQYVLLTELGDGKYTMESMVSNGDGLIYFGVPDETGYYMDIGVPLELTVNPSGDYYLFSVNGGFVGYDGTSTVLATNLSANDPGSLWIVMSEDDVKAEQANILASATKDNPVDATFLIKDAGFGRNRRDAAEVWTMVAENQKLGGGVDASDNNGCAESWCSVFSLSQTIENLPAGPYKFSAQGFYYQGVHYDQNLPYFYLNDQKSVFNERTGTDKYMWPTSASFQNGLYEVAPMIVEIGENGTLTVGAKLENNTTTWCIWDNFRLTYYGPDASIDEVKLSTLVEYIEKLRQQAQELRTAENVSAPTATALNNAYIETEDVSMEVAALNEAVEKLTAPIKQAKLDINNKAAIDAMYELMERTNVYTQEAYDTYKAAADAYLAKYNEGTLTEKVVNPLLVTAWQHDATLIADDLLLSAWTIGGTQAKDFTTSLYINTWSVEGEIGYDGTNFKVPFYEYWVGDGESLAANPLQATVTGLKPGKTYNVTAWTRVRMKNGAAAPATGITFQVGEGEAVDACAGEQVGTSQLYIAEIQATGAADEEGNLTITYNVAADNNISWLSFQNVRYAEHEENIDFADANVKALCVANWDTNGDGELSYQEAAVVTDLGTVFKNNTSITSFDELQCFTGLTFIDNRAFYFCSGLTSITIPESVTSIGENAFRNCTGLTNITIPEGVTSIGLSAFSGCTGLTNITIPESVTSIGLYAFSDCAGLTSIIVDNRNPVYDSRENCNAIIETSTNKLLSGCNNTLIPEGVTSIGYYAFSGCSDLTSITIPEGVKSISGSAFSGCTGLTSITIPESVTFIGDETFQGCAGLTSITIPNGVTEIFNRTFSGCTGLTSITIPESVSSISNSAFSGCSGLTSVTLNSNKIVSKDYQFNSSKLEDIFGNQVSQYIIGDAVTSIGNSAFSGCTGLTSITIPESVTSIGREAFTDCSSLTKIEIPNGITTIDYRTFQGCSGLTSITIPEGVTSIGPSAFSSCTGLTSITIPESVASIGSAAFSGCNSLPVENNIRYAGPYLVEAVNKTLPTYTIREGTKIIGYRAFEGCSSLTNITIPESVTSIDLYAFSGCTGLTSITIPESVTTIGGSAFSGCSKLATVKVGNSTPVSIASTTFSRKNATLIVPSSAVSAYKTANYWKDFQRILCEEDWVNYLEISDLTVEHGAEINLPVSMTNQEQITAAEFDLQVPNGIKLLSCSMTDRKNGHDINFVQNGNIYHVTIFSLTSSAIDGNEGELLNLKLLAGAKGKFNLTLKNMEFSTKEGERRNPPYEIKATVTIKDIKLGDVNGDGEVTITDAVSIVNHRLDRTPVRFISAAADLNADNEITITDAVKIVNMILSTNSNAKLRIEPAISLPEPQ